MCLFTGHAPLPKFQLIAFFPLGEADDRQNYEGDCFLTAKNVILRARCNLVLVEYDEKGSGAAAAARLPDIDLD
jgi:hypothetical protein